VIEIRSFRRVFDLERRIYRIDNIRLNPAGVPLRGVLYFLAAVVAAQLIAAVPLAGRAYELMPWFVRSLGLPAAAALFLGLIRIEGRPFHLAALAFVRFATGRADGNRRFRPVGWRPPDVVLLPDGSDAAFRALRYTGPGRLVVRRPHHRELRPGSRRIGRARSGNRRGLLLSERPGARSSAVAISVPGGGTVVTRPAARTAHR
jgi:hypothetical protein